MNRSLSKSFRMLRTFARITIIVTIIIEMNIIVLSLSADYDQQQPVRRKPTVNNRSPFLHQNYRAQHDELNSIISIDDFLRQIPRRRHTRKTSVEQYREYEKKVLIKKFGGGLESCLSKHESELEKEKAFELQNGDLSPVKSSVLEARRMHDEKMVEAFGGSLDTALRKHESLLERDKRLARDAAGSPPMDADSSPLKTLRLRSEQRLVEKFGGGLDSILRKHECGLERDIRLAREEAAREEEEEQEQEEYEEGVNGEDEQQQLEEDFFSQDYYSQDPAAGYDEPDAPAHDEDSVGRPSGPGRRYHSGQADWLRPSEGDAEPGGPNSQGRPGPSGGDGPGSSQEY